MGILMSFFNYKQVIVMRTDLNMSRGKIAVQSAHAAVAGFELVKKKSETWSNEWFKEGQKKVIVTAESKEEILMLKEKAELNDLPTMLIQDKGLTEIPPGTITCLVIGPAPSRYVDKVTRDIPLLGGLSSEGFIVR